MECSFARWGWICAVLTVSLGSVVGCGTSGGAGGDGGNGGAGGIAGSHGPGGVATTIEALCNRMEQCNELVGMSRAECIDLVGFCVDETFVTTSLQEDWATLVEQCQEFSTCATFLGCLGELSCSLNGGTGGSGGSGGVSGTGGSPNCLNVDCDDQNQCTIDGICDPLTRECEGGGFTAPDTACSQDGGQFCDGAGQCVECNRSAQCADDGNECTTATCNSGACSSENVGGGCDFNGQAGTCQNGICVDANLCDPYLCEDRGQCIADECNPSNGACSYPNAPENTTCSIGAVPGQCRSGVCDLCAPVSCDDGSPCTIDGTCNPNNGQCQGGQNVANGVSCGDAAYVCSQGVCVNDALRHDTYTGQNPVEGIFSIQSSTSYRYGQAGFYLNFLGSGVDHEIEEITSGWFLTVVSGGEPTTVGYLIYADRNADDDYSYRFNSQELPIGTSIPSIVTGSSAGGTVDTNIGSIPAGYTPVLVAFSVDRGTDHNLKRLSVQLYPSGSQVRLIVRCADNGADDGYAYAVRYALVPSHRVRAFDSHSRSGITGSDTQAIAAQRPILMGFDLNFESDHHVDQVGVQLDPGTLYVWFNDQNNDDRFSYEVRWADLQ